MDTYEREVYYFNDKNNQIHGCFSKTKAKRLHTQYVGFVPGDHELRSVKYKYFHGQMHNDIWHE